MPNLALPVKAASHQCLLVWIIAHCPDVLLMSLEIVHSLQTGTPLCSGRCVLSG